MLSTHANQIAAAIQYNSLEFRSILPARQLNSSVERPAHTTAAALCGYSWCSIGLYVTPLPHNQQVLSSEPQRQ